MPTPLIRTSAPPGDGPDEAAALAGDLTELRAMERRERRMRTGIAAGFFLIGAALTVPFLPTLPPGITAALLVGVLAVFGALRVLAAAGGWVIARYTLVRPDSWRVWRWRIARRWYAPGSTVWRTVPAGGAGPLAVLGWHSDPACRQVWALVYDGAPLMSGGGGAVWLPLTDLSATPPPPAVLARHPATGPR